MYPTGIITNMATSRFHPISFRPAPMPGGANEKMMAQRWRSIGHHIDGFDNVVAAQAWITAQGEKCINIPNGRWEWDGEGMPAMTIFLTDEFEVV